MNSRRHKYSKIVKALPLLLILLSIQFTPPAQAALGEICSSGIEDRNGSCSPFSSIAEGVSFCAPQRSDIDQEEIIDYVRDGGVWGIYLDFGNSNSLCANMAPPGLSLRAADRCTGAFFSWYWDSGGSADSEACLTPEQEAVAAHALREGGVFPVALLDALENIYAGGGDEPFAPIDDPQEPPPAPPAGYYPSDQEETSTSTSTPIALGLAPAIYNLYNWALGVGAMLALAIIIYGGVLYSASAGNPSRIEEAKKWITSALFGLALLFSTVIILNLVNPRLTTLQDIDVAVNPEINVGFNIVGGGGGDGGSDFDLPVPPPACKEACGNSFECNALPACPDWACPLTDAAYGNSWLAKRGSGGGTPGTGQTCSGGATDHRGIDIFNPAFAPVFAIEDGIITIMRSQNVSGNVIYMTGDSGYTYQYYHLADYAPKLRPLAREDRPLAERTRYSVRVVAGEHIAYTGCTETAGPSGMPVSNPAPEDCRWSPHIHFQLRGYAACGASEISCRTDGAGCYQGYNNPYTLLNLACR